MNMVMLQWRYKKSALAYDYRVLSKPFNSAQRQQDRVARRVVRPRLTPMRTSLALIWAGCTALPQA